MKSFRMEHPHFVHACLRMPMNGCFITIDDLVLLSKFE